MHACMHAWEGEGGEMIMRKSLINGVLLNGNKKLRGNEQVAHATNGVPVKCCLIISYLTICVKFPERPRRDETINCFIYIVCYTSSGDIDFCGGRGSEGKGGRQLIEDDWPGKRYTQVSGKQNGKV